MSAILGAEGRVSEDTENIFAGTSGIGIISLSPHLDFSKQSCHFHQNHGIVFSSEV
jgi:hypothetical protein